MCSTELELFDNETFPGKRGKAYSCVQADGRTEITTQIDGLVMEKGSGTLGRRGLKGALGPAGMRRQRSLEWRQERGYSSSEEEIPTRPVDSHVFASLLAQAQQEYSSIDRSYRSDDTEDAVTTDNPTTPFPTPPPTLVSPRSPLPLHRQASPFPLENTNSRRIHYATPQDRHRGNNGEVVYASNKKGLSNNTLGRNGRGRHRGAGGMTSSSSATSCNSCTDGGGGRNDIAYHADPQQRLCLNNDVNEESPPEPAPPEVPPRGPSLHSATLRRRADYNLPVGETNQANQESSQYLGQGEYVLSGSPRTGGYPARSPMASNTNSQHR